MGQHFEVQGDAVSVKQDDRHTIGVAVQSFYQLLAGAVALLRQADLLSTEAWDEALVFPDGMIRNAASRLRCASVQDSCCQTTTSPQPHPCPPRRKVTSFAPVTTLALLADFRPANDGQKTPAAAFLLPLVRFNPGLHLHTIASDTGFGFDVVLHTAYHLQALRVIDLRAHATNPDKSLWPLRAARACYALWTMKAMNR